MADRRVKVGLELEASNFEAGAKRAKRAAEDVASATEKIGKQTEGASSGISRLSDSIRSNSADLEQVGGTLAGVGAGLTAAAGASAKAAMDWETAFTGVKKTVDDTTEGYAQLEDELRGLATTLPTTHQEVAAVAEAAGQLGVAREDIVGFTKTMIDLGESTNLTADEAATQIAQISNVMGTMEREGAEGRPGSVAPLWPWATRVRPRRPTSWPWRSASLAPVRQWARPRLTCSPCPTPCPRWA